MSSKTTRVEILDDGTVKVICDLSAFAKYEIDPRHCQIVATIAPDKTVSFEKNGQQFTHCCRFRGRARRDRHLYSAIDHLLIKIDNPYTNNWYKDKISEEVARAAKNRHDEFARDGHKDSKKRLRYRFARSSMVMRLENVFWRHVLPHLDQEALRISRAVRGDQTVYNHLCSDRAYREVVQVSRAVSWISSDAPQHGEQFQTYTERILRQNLLGYINASEVDNDAPEGVTVTPGFLRWMRLAHFTPPFCGQNVKHIIVNLYKLQEHLDPNRIASLKGSRQWYTFHYIVARTSPRPFIVAYLRNPSGFIREVLRYFPPHIQANYTRYPALLEAVVYQIQDVARWFEDMNRGNLYDLSIIRQVEEARAYHQHLQEREAERRRVWEEKNAKLLMTQFPEPPFANTVGKKYQLVWLYNGKQLHDEGHALGHCVGGYVKECLSKRSIIYGVRNLEDARIATLELDHFGNIRQLYGQKNRLPDKEVQQWVRNAVQKEIKEAEKRGYPFKRLPQQNDREAVLHDYDLDVLPF